GGGGGGGSGGVAAAGVVPDSVTTAGGPSTSPSSAIFELRTPPVGAAGTKRTCAAHAAPGASTAGQALVTGNSPAPPVDATSGSARCSSSAPVFAIVNALAAEVAPTAVSGNVSDGVDGVAFGPPQSRRMSTFNANAGTSRIG